MFFEATLRPSLERELRASLSIAAHSFVLDAYAVARGDRVRKGDLVARLSSPNATLRLAQERSMNHLLQAQLADAQRAAAKGNDPTAKLGVTAATQRLAQSQAALDAQLAIAEGLELRSPIDGVIAELPALPAPGGTTALVARVVAIDPLRLEVPIPFGDRVPQRGAVLEGSAGPMRWRGIVSGIAPVANSGESVTLVIDVANPDGLIPAGFRASGEIDVGARAGCFVPSSALLRRREQDVVWVLGSAGFAARKVWPVTRAGASSVEVRGVYEGERVLRDALDQLAEGVFSRQERDDE